MGAADFIRVPSWDHPDFLDSVEHRIDDAISSANSILNFVLGPVRGFVGAVLHPVIAFADLTIGWVYGVIHWAFDRVGDLASQVKNAVTFAVLEAKDYAASLVSSVVDIASGVGAAVRDLIAQAVHVVYRTVRSWVNDAIHYASAVADGARDLIARAIAAALELVTGWVHNAIAYTSRVADAVRDLIARATEATLHTVGDLLADVRGFAETVGAGAVKIAEGLIDTATRAGKAALDFVVEHVVKPIAGKLDAFIDQQWSWAVGLLHLVEDAGEWIVWVGRFAVPEAVAIWRWLSSEVGDDIGSLLSTGIAVAAPARP